MTAGETLLVALTVDGNVLEVTGLQLLHVGFDDLQTTLLTGRLGGHVAVETGTVPVTGDGLGVERDADTELFGDTVEEETGHPELVTDWKTKDVSNDLTTGAVGWMTYAQCPGKDRPGTPTGRA